MKISRPIVIFDTETTGTEVATAKIVSIAVTKIDNHGIRKTGEFIINPEIPIPKEATDVHGITDEMVKDAKPFRNYARALYNYFFDCDLAGFNSDIYDIPLLSLEFERCGIVFPDWNPSQVDVLAIHRTLNPNTLSDVYKYYTGMELENAHNAGADNQATEIILGHIMKNHFSPEHTPEDLDKFVQGDRLRVDIAKKLYMDKEGIIRWNFTEKRGQPVSETQSTLDWALKQKFIPEQTKAILKQLKK